MRTAVNKWERFQLAANRCQPTGKISFRSRGRAKQVSRILHHMYRKLFKVYYCHWCCMFHLAVRRPVVP